MFPTKLATLIPPPRVRIVLAALLLAVTVCAAVVDTVDARSRSNCRRRAGRRCPSLGAGGGGGPGSPPPFQAELVSVSRPALLAPGEEGTVVVRLRNTGTEVWGPDVTLGTHDHSPIRDVSGGTTDAAHNRVPFTSGFYEDPYASRGDVAVFTYRVRGPADEAHAYRQPFVLLREPDERFPDGVEFGQELNLAVPIVYADEDHFPPELSADDCTWGYVAQSATPAADDGGALVTDAAPAQATFTITNTSELCPWFPGGSSPLHLGTSRPQDRSSGFADIGNGWGSTNRILMPTLTRPGESVTFSFGLRAAPGVANGDYAEYFHPVIEGKFHLADTLGMYMPVHKR